MATVEADPEVDEARPPSLVDHNGLGRQRAVGDPGGAQGLQLAEHAVQGAIGQDGADGGPVGVADRSRPGRRVGAASPPRPPVRLVSRRQSPAASSSGGADVLGRRSARGRSAGGRVTNRASRAGPAGPAASTSGTRAPARSAIIVR